MNNSGQPHLDSASLASRNIFYALQQQGDAPTDLFDEIAASSRVMGDSAPRRGAVSFDEPASDLEAKHRAVLTAIEQLEESEIYAGPFAVSSTIRGDSLALFGRVVETVLVILAVQHALNITKSTDNLYVVPVLFLFVFINSHLRYVISHWSRMVALARRRLNKTENEELAEKQRYLKSIADAKEPIATSAHDAYCLPRTSDYYYELPESIRSKFPLPGVYTLAQVRLASSEMVFAFVSNLLYLVNVYITFLLVKEIIDKINSSFSDGIWVLVKAMVFVHLIIPIYVEFQVAGYRQDVVARPVRITGTFQ